MSERHLNPSEPKVAPQIETVYTTVESQPDQTDWLTVVSNLRQINRQLVEQIARLEQALASSKQTLHTYKEEKQTHEITILQQQDELRIAQDRIGALFQQLETSHQIGQRQQTLIETISQQLEITQAIIPHLEAENNDLRQKYQQQTQKLTKTEQVALELHRRMKHQAATPNLNAENDSTENSADIAVTPPASLESLPTELAETQTSVEAEHPSAVVTNLNSADAEVTPSQLELTTPETSTDAVAATAEILPTNPTSFEDEIPGWTPTPPTATRMITTSAQVNWRDEIEPTPDRFPSAISTPPPPPEVVNKESTITTTPKPAANWPAPTLEWPTIKDESLNLPAKKTVIDLPKFPKKK